MPPWELDELKDAAEAISWFNAVKTMDELERRFKHYGGSARRVLADAEMEPLATFADGCAAQQLYALVTPPREPQKLSLVAYARPGPHLGSLVHVCPDCNPASSTRYSLTGARYKFASELACEAVINKLNADMRLEMDTLVQKYTMNEFNSPVYGNMVNAKIYMQLANQGAKGDIIDLHTNVVYKVRIPPAANRAAHHYLGLDEIILDDDCDQHYFRPAQQNAGAVDAILPPRVCIQSTIANQRPIKFDAMLSLTRKLLVGLLSLWAIFTMWNSQKLLVVFQLCPG